MKKKLKLILILIVVAVVISKFDNKQTEIPVETEIKADDLTVEVPESDDYKTEVVERTVLEEPEDEFNSDNAVVISDIPQYNGQAWIEYNNNQPFFTAYEIESADTQAFELYGMDEFNRPQTAFANVCEELMPTEERGEIGQIKPVGWHTVKYDCIEDMFLYNRCHLIAYCLTAENANEQNLITGTRYLNTEGILPTEIEVAQYVESTHNHVLYRVTPVYDGNNLLCNGVLMEGYSVEDNGQLSFCRYAFNVQPQIIIDYSTGDSYFDESTVEDNKSMEESIPVPVETENNTESVNQGKEYILNTNSLKIHLPSCDSVAKMSDKNKEEYTGSLEDLYAKGYTNCQNCLK